MLEAELEAYLERADEAEIDILDLFERGTTIIEWHLKRLREDRGRSVH